MKKEEKRRIALLLIVLLIVVIVKVQMGKGGENKNTEVSIGKPEKVEEEFVEVLEDGTKLNKSEQLSRTKTLGNLEFTNIQLTNQNGQTLLLADVKNTGTTASNMQLVDIIILDKNGGQLGTVVGVVAPLEAGQSIQFNTSMTMDYANAYDFQIVAK